MRAPSASAWPSRSTATLTELNLGGNQIGDSGAIGLGKGLEVNATLTTLSLWRNQIGDSGATGLSKALEVNATLLKAFIRVYLEP
jgi:hypothetical protein